MVLDLRIIGRLLLVAWVVEGVVASLCGGLETSATGGALVVAGDSRLPWGGVDALGLADYRTASFGGLGGWGCGGIALRRPGDLRSGGAATSGAGVSRLPRGDVEWSWICGL